MVTMTTLQTEMIPNIQSEKISLIQQIHQIDENQDIILTKFKKILENRALYISATETTKPSHPDYDLIRFLKARKWDIEGAAQQFQDVETWRKTDRIDELYENFDIEEFQTARKYYPQFTGRRDRNGVPVYNFVVSSLDSKAMVQFYKSSQALNNSQSELPARDQRLFAVAEHVMNFVTPVCTAINESQNETGKPVVTTTNIVDISGVGITQFLNLKKHLQAGGELATNYFPESLERVFVIGAPYFFPRVWSFIKTWFLPETTKKIHILSPSEVTSTLLKHIEPQNLPKRYGGELEWDFGMPPKLDDEFESLIGQWPQGPARFVDGKVELFGTENGIRRRS